MILQQTVAHCAVTTKTLKYVSLTAVIKSPRTPQRVNLTTANGQILVDLDWLSTVGLLFCDRAVFWCGCGDFDVLVVSIRVSLTLSFRSRFCCSSKSFSFGVSPPSSSQASHFVFITQFVTWYNTFLPLCWDDLERSWEHLV